MMLPLYLITTPIAVLPSLGLEVSVGLSGDDPNVSRKNEDSYEVTCSLYKPDGSFLGRPCLGVGRIGAGERQLHSISELSNRMKLGGDHLAVVHRIPFHYEIPRDYSLYRAVVQYSVQGSASHGRVIYESPPNLNIHKEGKPPSSTLTYTNTIYCGPEYSNYLVLMHYSMDAAYKQTANYTYVVMDELGSMGSPASVELPPFTVQAVPIGGGAGLATLVGLCENAAILVLVLTMHHPTNSVSVEHTHPAQSLTIAAKDEFRNQMKREAAEKWKKVLC